MPKFDQIHTPVLVEQVMHYLQPKIGESYFDVTAGYGGHAHLILTKTRQPKAAVLVDRDAEAVSALHQIFTKDAPTILQQDFLNVSRDLLAQGRRFDLILADLGVSSPHLDRADRGFSIAHSGPLDMRMDTDQELTAKEIVNTASASELKKIFEQYGEEPKAQQISAQIIRSRPVQTSDQLAAIAVKAWPGNSRVHPATRIFQALRIAVNDELSQLAESLPLWLELLEPNGRVAIISFHSLEDRAVKQFLNEHSAEQLDGELKILTRKPVTASSDEITSNPRARSAKLRAAAKIKTK